MNAQRKAVALISGGLDSMLAARMVLDQGVHVEGINFFTGFCVDGHAHSIRTRSTPPRNNSLWVAEQLGIKLHIIDVIEEYKSVLLEPKHGYGQHMNPCLDCKGFMVRKPYEWMLANVLDGISAAQARIRGKIARKASKGKREGGPPPPEARHLAPPAAAPPASPPAGPATMTAPPAAGPMPYSSFRVVFSS